MGERTLNIALVAWFVGFWMACMLTYVAAHDHILAATSEQAQVYEMYQKWNRPKGNFQGIGHRTQSCCNKVDCFPVGAARISQGVLWIRVQYPDGALSSNEYQVNPTIIESNQEDPRESPDARSHACIIGGTVACFVEGAGG
jgi:hypothetical protein